MTTNLLSAGLSAWTPGKLAELLQPHGWIKEVGRREVEGRRVERAYYSIQLRTLKTLVRHCREFRGNIRHSVATSVGA